MPGWMIETGYKYAKVASLAWAEGNLGSESEVNAALAVEILLKSLLAEPVENELTGTAAEQFKITGKNPGHNLFELYKAIPADLRSKLGLVRHVNTFKEKKDVFTTRRYSYEPRTEGTYDNTLLHLAAELIPKLVEHFIESGSTDPWLQIYKAYPNLFLLPKGIGKFAFHPSGHQV
ncbi:hypothetical protein [Pseudomonas aeruginosa]|uniref:hypothetical protein n=1 Tax=Pseudomonas aeruginosa TaxID=287 RepID=UPI000F526166|nr:hypothetical protein [Pseudomonas aeruginosa]MBX5551481.1 hypothetical protein [Pseudomonas aeruginosa]MDA3251764.1 hypothetical protein [Pseudomonas aeruginosa]HBO5654328.1 hypothetical protein [Pseudomonas aeruginosa]HCI1862650.1 hypothetical protein [Pseudomonas aeruginosa]HCI2644238.1 hypothetical protein [Pseudomonas aeruginosa]